jgi:TRAP-type C4-dicarboxylate transport system substrate-binding protein
VKKNLPLFMLTGAALLIGGAAFAKLPPPTQEAAAKAAEAALKTAWSGKVANYQLCKSQETAAAHYFMAAKAAGKEVKPAAATPACADPGPFVSNPQPAEPAKKS